MRLRGQSALECARRPKAGGPTWTVASRRLWMARLRDPLFGVRGCGTGRSPRVSARDETKPTHCVCTSLVEERASSLRPVESALFRVTPEDYLLERKVLLSDGSRWVPPMPDGFVEGQPGLSCKNWLFDGSHETPLNLRTDRNQAARSHWGPQRLAT